MSKFMKKNILLGLILAALSLSLSSCTLYLRGGSFNLGTDVSEIVTVFEPTRGTGSSYAVGENIGFQIQARRDGYITLSAMDPDGRVYVFDRNIFVRAGVMTYLPQGKLYELTPPRGLHRVRATFTPSVNGNRTSYNVYGDGAWTQSIVAEIQPYAVADRDVVETNFTVY